MACVSFPASTLSAGPAAVAGAASVTVAAALFDVSPVASAVTVTVAGAGNGLSYNPVLSTDPTLPVQLLGPVTSHVTAELNVPVPFTVAENCAVVPIVTVAVVGVIVTPVIAFTGGGGVLPDPPPPHPTTKAQTAELTSPAQDNKFIRMTRSSPVASSGVCLAPTRYRTRFYPPPTVSKTLFSRCRTLP